MMSKTKKPDMPVIAGCLRGLTSYLTNFTQSVEEGSFSLPTFYLLLSQQTLFIVFPSPHKLLPSHTEHYFPIALY